MILLTHTPFVVGRGAHCDGVIRGQLVSRTHAVFTQLEANDQTRCASWSIEDKSTNGTYIESPATGQVRAVISSPCHLSNGDKIVFGDDGAGGGVAFRFRMPMDLPQQIPSNVPKSPRLPLKTLIASSKDETVSVSYAWKAVEHISHSSCSKTPLQLGSCPIEYGERVVSDSAACRTQSSSDILTRYAGDQADGTSNDANVSLDGSHDTHAGKSVDALESLRSRGDAESAIWPLTRGALPGNDDNVDDDDASVESEEDSALRDFFRHGVLADVLGESGAANCVGLESPHFQSINKPTPPTALGCHPKHLLATSPRPPKSVESPWPRSRESDVILRDESEDQHSTRRDGLLTPQCPPTEKMSLVGYMSRTRDAKEAQRERLSQSADWLETGGQLAARFGAPPFTVLDARKGYWKQRKKYAITP